MRLRLKRLFALIFISVMCYPVTAQTIINVPSDYPTIAAALNAASSGDTILVAPGTYQESIDMPNKFLLLASWFLTTGDTSYISQTILDGNGSSRVIGIPGSVATSPTITGFTIQDADDGISPHARFNILNCYIIDCSDGIDYESGSGGLCKFNVFENNSDDGIDLDNDVDIIIEDNIIRNNDDDGIEIRLQSYTGPLLTCIIRGNLIYGNGEDGIQLIDYNSVTDRFFLIERNLIYNNDMVGLGCMGNSNTSENYEGASIPERIYLFNNTFVGNNYGVTGGDSLVSVNNIFVDHPGIAMKNVDGGSIVSYGIYWNNGTDFESSNLDNPHIIFSDPLLNAQFHLQPTSPAIDAGTALFIWQGDMILNLPSDSYNGNAPDLGAFESSTATNIITSNSQIPSRFQLYQNYPNPFNSSTSIRFDIPLLKGSGLADITLVIYDSLGQLIKTLYKDKLNPGSYEVQWHGRTNSGNLVPSGIYFVVLRANGFFQARKLVLLK
jgi:parallel beta-helix repeat protein